MRIYKATDYNVSRKAANIISAQIIMKPDCVLGLATGSFSGRNLQTVNRMVQ